MAAGSVKCFKTFQEFSEELFNLENRDTVKYIKRRNRGSSKLEVTDFESLQGYRIRFEDESHPSSKQCPIQCDGSPFVITSTDVYQCHQGPTRKKKVQKKQEHSYDERKHKKVQVTKKQGCPAEIRVRTIIKFPEYKINGNVTERKKRSTSQTLKQHFSKETTVMEKLIIAVFPNAESHQNHPVGEVAGYTQPLDPSVIAKIKELAVAGHRNVASVKLCIEQYVKSELAPGAASSNRRFYPLTSDIRTHIYHTVVGLNLRSASDDQVEVQKLVDTWKQSKPDDYFFFRPASSSNESVASLLLVMQTKFQRKMLAKYGQSITLLDATYKTTKYEIPLYNICVNTNVGFLIVGSFFVSIDTTSAVAEALQLLKEWNPTWHPDNFMCDYDLKEIRAVEETFAGCQVLLCDFHRIQAWQRWLSKNGISSKEEVLKQLSAIAGATDESVLQCSLDNFRGTDLYKDNANFRNWIEKKWLSEAKRWVYCYRNHVPNIISTTNGLEKQHLHLKHHYLKEFGIGKSLANVATVVIEKFFVDAENSYKRDNVKSRGNSLQYSSELPDWLKDRPKSFIMHCLSRMPPAVSSLSSDDIEDKESHFIVTSHDSGEKYTISKSDLPSCSCMDFKYRKWPCKHLLALWTVKPENTCLKSYFSQPLFTLDNDIFIDTEVQEPTSIPTVPSQQEQILTDAKVRKLCLEKISQIESSIYNSNDINLLTETLSSLQDVQNNLNEKSNKTGGLPLRKKFKWRRTSLRRQKKNKYNSRNTKNIKRIKFGKKIVSQEQPGDCSQPPPEYMQEGTVDCKDDGIEKALFEIWNQPPDDQPVLQVGPFSVTRRSFHYIKTTLSDDVIDASLAIILKQRNIFHIDCITATAIFHGQENIHHNLCQVDLNLYEACIGAVNESGGHWVLVIIEPVQKTVTYLNPLGELHGTCARFMHYWYDFLTSRYRHGYENNPPEGWTLKTVPHARQIDGTSCGVYVIKFAENYVQHQSMTFDWTIKDLEKARKQVAYRLLSAGFGMLESHNKNQETSASVQEIPYHTSMPEVVVESPMPEVIVKTPMPEVSVESLMPEVIVKTPMPEVSVESPMPEVIVKTPMPEVIVETPMPEVCVESPMPEVIVKTPMPEVIVESPMPEVIVKTPMPEVIVESPMPEVSVESPMPEVIVKTPMPEVIGKSPMPEVIVETPIPEVIVESPMPEVIVKTPMPEVSVESPMPEVIVKTPMPEVSVESPMPEVSVESPMPEVIVESPMPEVIVESPMPEVIVKTPMPEVSVESPMPEVSVESPVPEVIVKTPMPEVIVESPMPEVSVESPMPEVIVKTPMPEVIGKSPMPEVIVETPIPEVIVESPRPEDIVKTPMPEVIVETPMPEVSVESPMPEVIVKTPMPEVIGKSPMPEVIVETPIPEVIVESPMPEDIVKTPMPEVIVETPMPEVIVETPMPEVIVKTPMPEVITEKEEIREVKVYELRSKIRKRKLSSFVYPEVWKKKRKVYCVCRKPYDKTRFMILCNECGEWYHLECIGLTQSDVPKKRKKFLCKECQL